MFERFTDRARKAMALANQEAQRLHHEYIGTEHILIGLVEEGYGVAANVLRHFGVDLAKLRTEVSKLVAPGAASDTLGKLPQTPHARHVIELAIREARNLHHNYVGTEHVLLGILDESNAVADQVLMNLGLKLDVVRQEILNLISPGHDHTSGSSPAALAYIHVGPERMTRLQALAEARKQAAPDLVAEILDEWLKRNA